MKHKYGFTLVELLAVIVILAIILSLAIPTMIGIINKSKDNTYNTQIDNIVSAAKFYISDNVSSVSDLADIGDVYYLSLSTLSAAGYLELPITNPKTGTTFDANNSWVIITKVTSKSYTYGFTLQAQPVDTNAPTVVFGTNGNSTYAKTRNTTVTASDAYLAPANLKYQWTTSTTAPTEASFSTTFTNGATINTPSGATGTYYLWILAKDKSGNTTIINSNGFNLDNTAPVITMTGSSPITIGTGGTYTDPGAFATDNINGVVTSNIVTTSTVIPTVAGTYTVTYNVSDSLGNAATAVVRTVIVTNITSPANFAYTGGAQTYTIPFTGRYRIELWGAGNTANPSYGAYTEGEILLTPDVGTIYIYVGGQGILNNAASYGGAGYNGGGNGYGGAYGSTYNHSNGGNGATDIRIGGTTLNARIMVAGGGSGGYYGPGGGITSRDQLAASGTTTYNTYGATQTAGGTGAYSGIFGTGGNGEAYNYGYGSAGGGGGYYGGAGGFASDWNGSGSRYTAGWGTGGSSYISGQTGCVAITSASNTTPKSGCTTGTTTQSCSYHYSGYVFSNTVMIDGYGYGWTNVVGSLTPMPSTTSGSYFATGSGNTGTGYARITYLGNT